MNCPICGGAPTVVDQGVFGILAHCGECYEGDPEASEWRRLQARADTREEALELWLERARDYAANDEVPPLPVPYRLARPVPARIELRVEIEAQRTRGWRTIREGNALVWRPV